MSRPTKPNQVPHAPFSLMMRGEPMLASAARSLLGDRWFIASGKVSRADATIDLSPCKHCDATVEWAWTSKLSRAPPALDRYVYARCTAHPAEHRWGFREAASTGIAAWLDIAKKTGSTFYTPVEPIPLTQVATPTPQETTKTMYISPAIVASNNPFAAFETWIDSKVGDRLTQAEAKLGTIDAEGIEARLAALIEAGLKSLRQVQITVPTMPQVNFVGRHHPALETVLRYIAAGERFFLLVGPAATGKSTIAGQVAEALKVRYCATAITQTMQREDLLGCRAHNLTHGTVAYRGTPIVETWESDGVVCLDEVDRGDPNTLCCLNSIEQGCLYIPRADDEGGPLAKSTKGIVIATANTYGTGASRTYVGANQLDAAFTDRFRVIEIGYDRDLEIAVCGGDATAILCVDFLNQCRERANKANVRRPLTTRFARRVTMDIRLNPDLRPMPALRAEAKGWSATEISAVFDA